MGLSGRKTKQRIPDDPRNLTWADDASRFGSSYLSKLGFDHTNKNATLGISGSGLSEHLKVHHKLDLLGIGAQHTQDPNGLAWKQNRDFENLLKRLNAGASGTEEDGEDKWTAGVVVDGFHRAKGEDAVEGALDEKKSKKRKREKDYDNDDSAKKKRKKKDKKQRLDDQADSGPPSDSPETEKKGKDKDRQGKVINKPLASEKSSSDPSPSPAITSSIPAHRHHGRAHRARFIASKRLAASSSAAVSEILGIASSSVTSASTSGIITPRIEEHEVHQLNVSSTSVGDYFKEKLRLVAAGKPSAKAADDVEVYEGEGTRGGIGSKRNVIDEHVESERVGLGMKINLGMMGPSRPKDTDEKSKNNRRINGKEERRQECEDSARKKKKGKRKEGDEVCGQG